MLIDSHCHLDFPALADKLPQVLDAMSNAGVAGALCIGVNLDDWPRVLELATDHQRLFASVGVHPEYDDIEEPDIDELCSLADHPKVIAIGETGLDYYWHKPSGESGSIPWQLERFRIHIRAAIKTGKPLIVHMRDAAADTLRLLREENAAAVGGIMHCFTEDWDTARRALDMNFAISFSGIVSFKNARQVHDVARKVPADRYLIETDSPYLAPIPFRGKLNQPAYVRHVAEAMARLRGVDVETIALESTQTFFRIFPTCQPFFQPEDF